jgi:succinyl-CoA synthetase beta subunit
MARVKLSEHEAKKLLFPHQDTLPTTSKTVSNQILQKFGTIPLVVKVDQGIKKRGKQGLVAVNVDAKGAVAAMRKWGDEWSSFIVEPMVEHQGKEEKYLSFERKRESWQVLQSDKGGIDIEKDWDSLRTIDPLKFASLIEALEKYHISFLELNPYLMRDGKIVALDAAAEIDDAALGLAELASLRIIPVTARTKSDSEKAVAELDAATPASLKFRLINPNGSIWVLLSGGGASLVLADEVADQGMGKELANYGEYSGAPTDDDVYAYTKIILKDMLKSTAPKKALVIAAGIANFTDVAKTFRGIIRALGEVEKKLRGAKLKVFVRRGGPNEAKGLKMMGDFLAKAEVSHAIHTHETPLTEVISEVKEYL